MNKNFKVLDDGTIVRDIVPQKTSEDILMAEYQQLEYEVNHLTRPTSDPIKIARYNELKKMLGIGQDSVAKKMISSKQKLKSDNSVLMAAIKKHKLENE